MSAAQLRRELGPWDVLALMMGITIGAGVFAMPGRVAEYFPSFGWIAVVWVGAAAFALIGNLVYAELGARLPHTGGEYVYLHRAFGPLPAFLFGWSQLLVVRTNPVAALPLVFAEYASSLVRLEETERLMLAAALILMLGAVNYLGLRSGKGVQLVTSVLKVGGMVAFVAAAVLTLSEYGPNLASAHAPPQKLGPLGNTARALLLVVFAYVGWDRVGYLAGEMRRPERDLPRALVGGSILVAVLYLSMNFIYYAALPIGAISGSRVPAADVARLLWGQAGPVLVALLVMVSTLGATNGNIMASSRVYYTMARDGLFPGVFGRVHPRWQSPHVAIILHCGWALALLFAGRRVETLVGSFVFAALIFWGASTVALFRFRRREAAAPFLTPGYPLAPAVFLVAVAALVAATCYFSPRSAFTNLALMGSGLPFYWAWRKLSRDRAAA